MKAQILYISHGGGPMPILGDRYHLRMVDFLKGLSTKLKRPDAIVVLSAHWECPKPTLLCAQNPSLLYDYYGFPEEAYQLRYPASMAVDLANHIASLFEDAVLDDTRGFDHGMFIPLSFLYPDADIPTTQLSLLSSLSSREHWNMGEALRPLLDENILFIGSGFSFHNMRLFFQDDDKQNHAFQEFLINTCTADLPISKREEALVAWQQAPYARYCHPREEHLLPLHVCCALAGEKAELVFDDEILKRRSVGFLWR